MMKESSIKDTKIEIRRVAINHLSRRDYTKHELLVRLNQRFESPEDVEEVVENLSLEGLQSDGRFAESFIRYRIQKGFGPIRIRKELQERGVEEKLLSASLEVFELDWEKNALEVLDKKFGKTICEDFTEIAKRARFMEHRGFSLEHCQKRLNL